MVYVFSFNLSFREYLDVLGSLQDNYTTLLVLWTVFLYNLEFSKLFYFASEVFKVACSWILLVDFTRDQQIRRWRYFSYGFSLHQSSFSLRYHKVITTIFQLLSLFTFPKNNFVFIWIVKSGVGSGLEINISDATCSRNFWRSHLCPHSSLAEF